MRLDDEFVERFFAKVIIAEGGCWEWCGAKNTGGYGHLWVGSKRDKSARMAYAHRVSYEMFFDAIPNGLEIDHLCRNRACVNPKHLEPVTRRQNQLRGDTFAARHAARTHCPNGHPYDEENTRRVRRRGGGYSRVCITCARVKDRARWPRRKKVA